MDSLKIMKHLKSSTKVMPQVLLFSATFNERVKDFSTKVVLNANQIFLPAHELSLDVIKQYRVNVASTEAKEILLKEKIFPCCDKIGQTIIFAHARGASAMRAMNEAGTSARRSRAGWTTPTATAS